MRELLMFGSSFFLVFALSLQQQNLHYRRFGAAAINATLIGFIGITNLQIGTQASITEMIAFIIGQPLATLLSMWWHERWLKKSSGNLTGGHDDTKMPRAEPISW